MAYPVETYIGVGSYVELERRFKLLEPLLRVYLREKETLRRAMEDPEWGRAKLTEIQEKIDDLNLDMTNIATVVQAMKEK